MNLSEIAVFVIMFFVCMGLVSLVPSLWEIYHERTTTSLRRTSRELDRFFLNVKPLTIIGSTIGFGVLIGVLTGNWLLATVLGIAAAFSPRLALAVWKNMRSAKFNGQFMDALLLMSNTLKSGLDIAAAVEKVSHEAKAPISEEFGLVINAYRLGASLEDAMFAMTRRINSRTLETLVYAITIQRDTGGNIIKIFDQIVQTIREEDKLQKKVKALTSQATTQIIVMASFPWALGALFLVLAPEIFRPAVENVWGQVIIAVLIVWEIIGVVVTKQITTVAV